MLNNQSVHTLPFTPSYPFASIPIQGEYILDQLVPGTPYKVHLQFTTEMDRLIKSNVVETCTIGPFLDPSSIPLPDSPKPSNTTGSSPNESVVMMAQLDHAFSESSLESLDLSDASHSPLPHSIYQTHNEETDLSSPEEIPVVDSEGDATH
ncbi:hypothetical protein HMI55_005258 [Coelomomyces lativittatus]|nr:hypothetical protein HMI55_005258 [Coelomomyces lativittatus]